MSSQPTPPNELDAIQAAFMGFESRTQGALGTARTVIEPAQTVPQPDANGEFATPADGAKFMASLGIPQIRLSGPNDTSKLGNPGKNPAVNGEGWPEQATTDFAQIDKWAKEFPGCNFGSVAQMKIDGFYPLETDSLEPSQKYTAATGKEFQAQLVVESSAPDRNHWYYAHSEDSLRELRNIPQKDAMGFSLRCNNEQCVSPGSIHRTGKQYRVVVNGVPALQPVEEIRWLNAQKPESTPRVDAAGEKILIPPGGHHTALLKELGSLIRRGYSNETAPKALLLWAHEWLQNPGHGEPLEDHIRKMVDSTENWERGNPGAAAASRGEVGEPAEASEATKISDNIVPAYPMDTIDGDSIGELTHALSDGTFIPPQFVRENLKVGIGLMLDENVGYPNHEDLHLRAYLHNISEHPQSGKGESYKRTLAKMTGFLNEMLNLHGVGIIDGGLFGSGEFMAKVLKTAPTNRNLVRYDEMSEVWTKTRIAGCTLEKKFLELFESKTISQGSFKNGVHEGSDFHVSIIGDFTKDSFDTSFTGSGARGSGYLSRCVFQFAERQPWDGDWLSIDAEKVSSILSDIETRIDRIVDSGERFIPSETDEAKTMRLDFGRWLDTQDARYIPRLKDHMKRDVLLRAVFSGRDTITTEMMKRSIDWCRNQLDNRIALFPEDAGSPTEVMERLIMRRFNTKLQASDRDLQKACHVERAGSGGLEVYNRAMRALQVGRVLEIVGRTHKGNPIYAPREC